MTVGDDSQARRHGREARRAHRAAARDEASRVVGPGLAGGAYRPLSNGDIKRIYDAALDILERVGMADTIPDVQEFALEKGCSLDERGRLRFPRALAEDVIAGAGRNFVLCGRDPRHDLSLKDTRVHFGTAGAAVKVPDFETGRYRGSTLLDLYDFARLVDRLHTVHWFSRTVVPTELTDLYEMDVNTAYACAAGTSKHIGLSLTSGRHVEAVVAMFDILLGGEGRFRERPFCQAHTAAVVSPLRYAEDSCKVAVAAARAGMPVNLIVAAQAGATAPAALAGTLVQTVAETLSGLIMVNLVAPGHPVIFSNWPFTSDLRTGAFTGGGGEEALLNAAAAQIANFYDLPSGVAAGMADSKLPDFQAGYEKGVTTTLTGLAGANLVYESAGMLASLLGCSFEALVMDNDLLGTVQRTVRGIEVTDETLSIAAIEEAVDGPGHYLGHAQTLSLMETEYLYPDLADRRSPDDWEETGALDMRARARERVRALLAEHYPEYIEPDVDAAIRERFPIRLPREAMRAGNG
ncbi:MAG: trimethylamine methyltransferase family protein, partial [Alphaproteobacteria bacterium]